MTSARSNRMKRVLSIALIILALALPWGVDSIGAVPAFVLNLSAIFCIVAVSLNLLTGYSGQVSLGHAGFVMLGEYVSSLLALKLGVPFWVALPTTMIAVGIVGFILGLPAVRLTGNFLAVATLGFGLAIPELALKWTKLTNGSSGLMPNRPFVGSFQLSSDLYYYYLILLCLFFVLWVSRNLLKSKAGRALQAVRDSEVAAGAVGIKIAYYKALVFAISAGFTGMAGSLYAHYVNFVSPSDFTLENSFLFFAMIVVGGLASLPGSIIGAVVMTALDQLGNGLGQFSVILTGVVMVVVVMFFPQGLVSVFRRNKLKQTQTSVSATDVLLHVRRGESHDVPRV